MRHPQFPELAWLSDDCLRVGVVVPPSNPVVEPELDALLGDDIILYSARLPRFTGMTLEQRNRLYVPAYDEALDSLEGIAAVCAYVAMTGPTYQFGVEGDRELCMQLSEKFELPVRTASLAIHDALTSLGINRIHLVSPYPGWLTEQTAAYWSDAGINVVAVDHLLGRGEEFRAYEMDTDEVIEHLRAVDPEPDCALLLTGTGMVSIASIYQMGHRLRVPILSSNLCGAWWILKECGHRPGTGLYRRIAPAHLPAHPVRGPDPTQ
jgi:maleate isomerase